MGHFLSVIGNEDVEKIKVEDFFYLGELLGGTKGGFTATILNPI